MQIVAQQICTIVTVAAKNYVAIVELMMNGGIVH